MAKFGAEILQTLRKIFPIFSKVHREKQFHHETMSSVSNLKEDGTGTQPRFASQRLKRNHILAYYESTAEGAKLIEGIKLNRSFIEEAVTALMQERSDLIWILVNELGELQYDLDGDLIVFRQGDGTILTPEQKQCQKVRVGTYESKIMIQGANVANFEWDKTYLFGFADTGELESIKPIGNNFYI